MSTKVYKIGVIGLGARGETFVRQLHEGGEQYELFGVCDIDSDRMGKFLEYCGVDNTRTFTDPDEFMNQAEMDAVIITTPDFAHLEVCEMAFAAGKEVYVDKPLEVTSERCRAIGRAQRESGKTCYVGFNLRASQAREKTKEIVASGILGQIIHIEGLEQITIAHLASFMRRFHRVTERSGGLLNTKCSHDMDIMQWTVGHQHKIKRVASFGGCNVLLPEKAPATHCHKCPKEIFNECPYKDRAGFVFPVGGDLPIHKVNDAHTYGADLCVYNDEKDLVDNQTVIMEWDNGVRGNFNLQGFQQKGKRELKVWGELGLLTLDSNGLTVRMSRTGETINYEFQPRQGGHGGTDPLMINRFIHAIETGEVGDSSIKEGLAATLIAEKALEALRSGTIIDIDPSEYDY